MSTTVKWLRVQSLLEVTFLFNLLLPTNKVCEGYVFTPVCQSFCSQGGCLDPGPGGRLGDLAGGCQDPDPGGGWGVWLGWVSRPLDLGRLGCLARGRVCPGPGLGGIQAHTKWGVCPGPHPGVYPSPHPGHVSRPEGCIPTCTEINTPSRWLLLQAACILLECILVLL